MTTAIFTTRLFSPLEVFSVHPMIAISDYITITNQFYALFLITIFIILILSGMFNKNDELEVIGVTRIEAILTLLYNFVVDLVNSNIHSETKGELVPFIFTTFITILTINLTGLIPYSFAISGQIAFTASFSYITFFASILIGWRTHGKRFFGRFFPGNLDIALSPLLVPIEVISFLFQPISLGVRLFANIMAGHILMNVFSLFIWMLAKLSGLMFTSAIIPVLILVPLCVLELAVALIQTYVFCLLTCIYLNDVINLH